MLKSDPVLDDSNKRPRVYTQAPKVQGAKLWQAAAFQISIKLVCPTRLVIESLETSVEKEKWSM